MSITTITETGCYLDNHRGHYITRDVVELAVGYGYIIGPCERFALDMYEHAFDLPEGVEYPHDVVVELADDAREWLNNGQDARMPGQDFPPIIPAGTSWDWNDGDFGLYRPECPDCGRPITLQPTGWWTHDGLANDCWRQSMDGPE